MGVVGSYCVDGTFQRVEGLFGDAAACGLLIDSIRFARATGPRNYKKVGVVQPNINAYTEKWSLPERTQLDKVLLEKGASDGVDLLVLPETFLPKARRICSGSSYVDRYWRTMLSRFSKAAIFGATTYDFQQEQTYYNRPMGDRFYTLYNSALFQNSTSKSWEVYHKGKLVVGGESMPFVNTCSRFWATGHLS